MKRFLKELLKVIVTGSLLFYLFRKVDVNEIIASLKNIDLIYIIIPIVLFFVYYLFFSLRWRYLLNSQDIKVTPTRSYLYIHIAFFFNNFLPSGIGMDAVRAGYAGGKDKFEKAFGASLMERVLGMAGMMTIGLFAFFSGKMQFIRLSFIYLGLILFIGVVYYLFVSIRSNWLREKILNIKFLNIGESIREFYRSIKLYRNRRRVIFTGIGYSILVQMAIILINYFLAEGLSIDIGIMPLIAFIPIITVISLIPVTVNGLGMREYAYVFFFTTIGIQRSDAMTLSLLFFATSVIASSIGGLIFLVFRKPETGKGERTKS